MKHLTTSITKSLQSYIKIDRDIANAKATKMFIKSFVFDELKNFIGGIANKNYYTREYWYIFLDYFNLNQTEDVISLLLLLYIVLFIICYIFVSIISVMKITKTNYHTRVF